LLLVVRATAESELVAVVTLVACAEGERTGSVDARHEIEFAPAVADACRVECRRASASAWVRGRRAEYCAAN